MNPFLLGLVDWHLITLFSLSSSWPDNRQVPSNDEFLAARAFGPGVDLAGLSALLAIWSATCGGMLLKIFLAQALGGRGLAARRQPDHHRRHRQPHRH
jgi:hypothetical protein